jgi:hypothetical protein
MAIRLGIDLDGVVCNNMPTWADFMNKRVPTCHPTLLEGNRFDEWESPYKACNKCFDEAIETPDIISSYDVYPFCVYAIDMMHRAGISMVVVTSRPDPVRYATMNFLKRVGILPYLEGVRFTDHDKQPVLLEEKLNFHLDDRPNVIEEMAGSSVTPIIFDQPYNVDLKGLRAYGWLDVAEIMVNECLSLKTK